MIINAKDHLENRLLEGYNEYAYNITDNILKIIPTQEARFIVSLFAQSIVSVCYFASVYSLYKEFKKAIQMLKQNKKVNYILLVKKLALRMISVVILNPISSAISDRYYNTRPYRRW